MPLSEIILVVMGLLTISIVAAAICSYVPIPYTVFLVILGIFFALVHVFIDIKEKKSKKINNKQEFY